MQTEKIELQHAETLLEGHLAFDPGAGPRPLVLFAHAWAGQDDFARQTAERLVGHGFTGFAMDVYGKGVLGTSTEQNLGLLGPVLEDRALLQGRLAANLEAARCHASVDQERVAVMGVCFGGLCALDMARADMGVRGVVSFHGNLSPSDLQPKPIRARVLALHGHDDLLVPFDDVAPFTKEMDDAGADWQFHIYGGTKHAFMVPGSDVPEMGIAYSERAARRGWTTALDFLAEAFA